MPDAPRVVLLLSHHAGYDRGILQGIVRYARIHGPWNLYLAGIEPGLPLPEMETFSGRPGKTTSATGEAPQIPLPDLRRWDAKGVIGRLQNPRIAKMALAAGIPVIAMDLSEEQLAGDLPLSRVSEIRSDSHEAGRMAAEHLLERGFRQFAYCGYAGRTWSERSREGFCKQIEKAGYQCNVYEPPQRSRPVLWQQERESVTAWLRSLPKPVGVMSCNDIRGRQVLESSALGGMSVPDEVAVVGVDDDQLLCELSNPPLSSVVLNAEQGGYQAAELLDALMSRRKRSPQRIDVEPLWVLARQSTDALAVDDPDVAAAVRYIRDHLQAPIGVQDVVDQVTLSRRALELRFEQLLGRSIRAEIQRARLAWAKRLLVETGLPVAKIAELAGFKGHSYLSEVFRRELRETPAHYRRRHRLA
jgi:LacI family transcriptional regulator